MAEIHVVVLGGGPAGCGAAYKLSRKNIHVTLIEAKITLGGNAGSFKCGGQYLDYGSHRLHYACDPVILRDIKSLIGPDLVDRERHGRIRLRGKWLHFPLKPIDLMLRLDRAFALSIARDMTARALLGKEDEGDTFSSVLMANLGPTICENFYFPYARKIWGREPVELSGVQARKRVSAGTFTKLLQRLTWPRGNGKFYYPRKGYGQITDAYAEGARQAGAEIMLDSPVKRLYRPSNSESCWTIEFLRDGETHSITADHVWSTIPITFIPRMVSPTAPREVLEAAGHAGYRAMILVYLELHADHFTETDAHYFPESHISMTRLSEPKNYSDVIEPRGRTTLCAELPCSTEDETWSMSDEELGRKVVEDMRNACLPLTTAPLDVYVKRLRQAYPIYTIGYDMALEILESWLESLPNFLSYGRQGLFAHDNTHHALFMAYCAADCLKDGHFDQDQWRKYRKVFATHVVED